MTTDKPAPTQDEIEAVCEKLESFSLAYPESIFGPVTAEEVEQHGNLITRNSAAMGRHCAKFMAEGAALIRRLAATVPQAWTVPREPTPAMRDAGKKAWFAKGDVFMNVWHAMYDAAPQAAPEPGAERGARKIPSDPAAN